ncbi:arabinosyltransferase domain-containing protein [Dietzia sp.]|uniref:arabinosyltransferase domain-containing protein n=1 Tax=Dietzia sp. TaxID=1871616 RepID=UPI002FD9BF30
MKKSETSSPTPEDGEQGKVAKATGPAGATDSAGTADSHPSSRWHNARVLAAVLGFLGAALSLLSGVLPVHQDNADIDWTPGGEFHSVSAPLVSGRPIALDIAIPCAAAADAPEDTVLLSTLPKGSEGRSSDGLMVVRGRNAQGESSLEIINRNLTLLSVPVSALRSGDCEAVTVTATPDSVTAKAGDATYSTGENEGQPIAGSFSGEMRPQVVGLFTDLTPSTAPDGLERMTAHVGVDARYSSSPTLFKSLALVLAVAATIGSLYYLRQLDRKDGRHHVRIMPARRRGITPLDGIVAGVLVVWHLVGANTSDDGYLLTMARSAGPSGYMANYFRWLGSPESPVGWYYEILKLMTHVSTASVWMRLPTLLCGLATWWVLTREVLPRLGRLARRWPLPEWAGAAVFLAFWMAFNNGLRPEPVLALGALVTWILVERAIATRRLLPAYLAVVVAAFSIGTGPTGVICIAILLSGTRSIVDTMRRRANTFGWAPVLGPLLAAGLILLVTVFADQTLSSVVTASRIRTELGPSLPWYGEKERWVSLLSVGEDGGVSRRAPVLFMLLSVGIVGVAMLRRGRIPGLAAGPARRIVLVILGSLLLLVFTPTKWTHHFGIFAGIGGAVAVVAVLALRPAVLGSARNAWLVGAAISATTALATATDNVWWYVSNYGMPFADSFPEVFGIQINYIAFLATFVCLGGALLTHVGIVPPRETWPKLHGGAAALAARVRVPRIVHAIADYFGLAPVRDEEKDSDSDDSDGSATDSDTARTAPDGERRSLSGPSRTPGRRNRLGLTASVFTAVALVLVAANLSSALVAVFERSPAYTVGRSNARTLVGKPCSLADAVLVEENSNDGLLKPVGTSMANSLGAGERTGFTPNGVPESIPVDTTEEDSQTTTAGGATVDASGGASVDAGTTGGQGEETLNGSTVALPFGLDPDQTPVLGSYRRGPQTQAALQSSWYELPERSSKSPLLVVAAAGWVSGSDLKVEYGKAGHVGPSGPSDYEVTGSLPLIDVGPAPTWRNFRIPLDSIPTDADVVRIVARDNNLAPDWWMAVTPPRNPQLSTLDEVVGRTDPVLADWVVALAFPCQRPFVHDDGVAEIPKYRILPDRQYSQMTNWWMSESAGGPLLWLDQLTKPVTVPTYLNSDWGKDWGSLQRLDPLDPDATPAPIERSSTTRLGTWSPGAMVS